jgi:hypothetical protein
VQLGTLDLREVEDGQVFTVDVDAGNLEAALAKVKD